MSESKLSGNVWILSSKKTDGRYNKGKIVGYRSGHGCLGFFNLRQFMDAIKIEEYQVAYQDCFTQRYCIEFFRPNELSKTNPTERLSNE
jgi:hypothetical protein